MFTYAGSPVPIRDDLRGAHQAIWEHIARPGPVFDASRRISILSIAREDAPTTDAIERLATTLYNDPGSVSATMVDGAVTAHGEAAVVETVSIVSMLAAVDSTHLALGAAQVPLPDPMPGDPTGNIASGLKKRRTYVPMPRNSITVALELLPEENEVYATACGPHYMTFAEMASPRFARTPGLDRAQLETVASRTSIHQDCFY